MSIVTTFIGGRRFILEVAATDAARKRGLGQRQTLPSDSGMLFIFTDAAVRRVWMKDMCFPIDIIWIGPDMRVQHIAPHISPDTYPDFFSFDEPTRYILELNAGMAQAAGLCAGQPVSFNS